MANASNLRAWLVRLAVLALGLLGMVGSAMLHKFAHLGLGWTLFYEYLAIMCVEWGINGFVFRRLPLSWVTLTIFSPAAFDVLFLLTFFLLSSLRSFCY